MQKSLHWNTFWICCTTTLIKKYISCGFHSRWKRIKSKLQHTQRGKNYLAKEWVMSKFNTVIKGTCVVSRQIPSKYNKWILTQVHLIHSLTQPFMNVPSTKAPLSQSSSILPCTETTALSSVSQIILRNWALCSSASVLPRNKPDNSVKRWFQKH